MPRYHASKSPTNLSYRGAHPLQRSTGAGIDFCRRKVMLVRDQTEQLSKVCRCLAISVMKGHTTPLVVLCTPTQASAPFLDRSDTELCSPAAARAVKASSVATSEWTTRIPAATGCCCLNTWDRPDLQQLSGTRRHPDISHLVRHPRDIVKNVSM